MIQGPPVQLYRDNLRTHVPMCGDYLQKGKNSRNRKERQNGKLIQDCCKRCRSEFGTNGSNKRLSLFYCKASTVLFMTKFCTKYRKHWCYFSSHRFICLAQGGVALPFGWVPAVIDNGWHLDGGSQLWLSKWLTGKCSNLNKFKTNKLGYIQRHNPRYSN